MSPSFQSTLSLRRATVRKLACAASVMISIHALLAESDRNNLRCPMKGFLFQSTLSLRRATIWIRGKLVQGCLFQSTLSLRRATQPSTVTYLDLDDFNPRSPCGERRHRLPDRFLQAVISIHALLAESDSAAFLDRLIAGHFNPRSPCGERLAERGYNITSISISIHALLAESDPDATVFAPSA